MIEILRKSYVALLVLFLALAAQIPHAAYVAYAAPYLGFPVQPQSNLSLWLAAWLLAYAYAIGVELLTLIFVVHGRRAASYGFAVASFLINLCYYAMHGVDLWSWSAFPAWLLSALNPVAIASYSHILAGAHDEPLHWPAWAVAGWAKVRGNAQPIVQPVTVSVQPIVHEEIGSVHSEVVTVHDGAPDPSDRAAYARWLHMEKGATIAQLSAQYGVHRNTVSKWIK